MVILAWAVQYHHGENREEPGMASQRVTVRIYAQVIEKPKKAVHQFRS